MSTTLILLGIIGAMSIGAISPGPSFVLVARTAVSSRRDGLAAALGMGVGGVIFAIAALAGLQAILLAVPSLYIAVKILGGLYLVYLGYRIWKGASQPLELSTDGASDPRQKLTKSFLIGLVTQLSNPKTAIVYASVFSAFLPQVVPLSLLTSIPIAIFCIEAGWYSLVALALSSDAPRRTYLRGKVHIDRIAGGVMGLLGLKLLTSIKQAS